LLLDEIATHGCYSTKIIVYKFPNLLTKFELSVYYPHPGGTIIQVKPNIAEADLSL